jgi:hypothetical protein
MTILAASNTSAATLNVVGGQLLGASGVIVDGSSYNVGFLDGTCIALYGGCDEVSDFTFQSSSAAELASLALLDQVFIDGSAGSFDSDPEFTNGCTSAALCGGVTPYGHLGTSIVLVMSARNVGPLIGPTDRVAATAALVDEHFVDRPPPSRGGSPCGRFGPLCRNRAPPF